MERYRRHKRPERIRPWWGRALLILLGILIVLVGVIFAFIPGPAILFYAIGGAIIATESRWMAAMMDRIEVACRQLVQRLLHFYERLRRRN